MYILTSLLVESVCNATKIRQDISGSLVYLVPIVRVQAIDVSRLGSLGLDIFNVAPGQAIYFRTAHQAFTFKFDSKILFKDCSTAELVCHGCHPSVIVS